MKYGEVSEIDALKMVTLNPAILLHLEDRMGSIREERTRTLSYGRITRYQFMQLQRRPG